MGVANQTNDSRLGLSEMDWTILRNCRPNVLLEGAPPATDAVLRLLRPHLPEPIVLRDPHTRLELPSEGASALILKDVAHLSADDQARLIAWIAGAGSRAQLVSTTARPLFARVARGLFDEALYYRLNVMLLSVGLKPPPE